MKMRFIGKTNRDFTNGFEYEFLEVNYEKYNDERNNYFNTYIINDYDNIRYVPYSSINTFLHNWEVVDE